ncbi:MAG: hypothetical protein HZA17_00510 [Nitrospirae bacterium]|nr:hypothetical protein [Nitrospirota bacterium]
MKKKIIFAICIGVFAEIIYMLSLRGAYPSNFVLALLPLSVIESCLITFIFHRLCFLSNLKRLISFALFYVVIRIPTRVFAVFCATGIVLLIADSLPNQGGMETVQILIAFLIDVVMLCVIMYMPFALIRRCLKGKGVNGGRLVH